LIKQLKHKTFVKKDTRKENKFILPEFRLIECYNEKIRESHYVQTIKIVEWIK